MSDPTPLSIHEPTVAVKGGIVVVHEGFGMNDHIEDVCARFAREGWLTLAPHLYHRTGDQHFAYEDMDQAIPVMDQLTGEGVLADMDAAIAHLTRAGVAMKAVGVVGFCLGGRVALLTTARRDVGAGVTFYGGLVKEGRFGFPAPVVDATRLRAPWLGLYGDLDRGIPPSDVEDLRAAAASSGQPTEIVRYADAGHGFHCDARSAYHAPSARDAWGRTLAWLDRHLTI